MRTRPEILMSTHIYMCVCVCVCVCVCSHLARVDTITLHAKGWNEQKKKTLYGYLSQWYIKVLHL